VSCSGIFKIILFKQLIAEMSRREHIAHNWPSLTLRCFLAYTFFCRPRIQTFLALSYITSTVCWRILPWVVSCNWETGCSMVGRCHPTCWGSKWFGRCGTVTTWCLPFSPWETKMKSRKSSDSALATQCYSRRVRFVWGQGAPPHG
jgi:hypothetical protein